MVASFVRPSGHSSISVCEQGRTPVWSFETSGQVRDGRLTNHEIDRTSIVGIDEIEVPQLAALINVGHAGRGEFTNGLNEAVLDPETRHPPHEGQKIGKEGVGLQRFLRESLRRLLIISVGRGPARATFRLAQRFLDCRMDALAISLTLRRRSGRRACRWARSPRTSGRAYTRRRDRARRCARRRPRRARRMRVQVSTWRRHSSGISDRTASRARLSSPRLVSCVAVASMACGQFCARAAFALWKRAGERPNRSGAPPTSLSATNRL